MRDEFVVPDTHPDVYEILMIDAKPRILNEELMQDKIYLEGRIDYSVLYMAKEDENTEVHCINYSTDFNNTVECRGASHEMMCESEGFVEHMNCNIVNERKISIEGIVELRCEVFKKYDYEIVRDVDDAADIQFAKNPTELDKIVGSISGDILTESHLHISKDKPEVGKIIKCDVNIHKKEAKVLEGKVRLEASAYIKILYKGKDSRDIYSIDDDIRFEKEFELDNASSIMENYTDFKLRNADYIIKEDDLGEERIVDIEILVKAKTKVMYKQQIDIIEDAYSPSMSLNMDKKEYEMNVMHKQLLDEIVVKGDIQLSDEMPRPKEIILCTASVCVTDKKVVEDKVVIDGVVNTKVLYKTTDNNKYICTVNEEIPFSCGMDMPGTKINMQCVCKVSLENIDADIEGGNIAVKAVIETYARVNYTIHKEFLVDICPGEDEIPKKKASITIYVVQNGDTLWKIAKKYNTTVEGLLKVNDIDDSNVIKVDEKLIIPGRAVI
jgi:LysM repeat protein